METKQELGINLSLALKQFLKILASEGSAKQVVIEYSRSGGKSSMHKAILAARNASEDKEDWRRIVGLGLVIRSRVANGAMIGKYRSAILVESAVDPKAKHRREYIYTYPSYKEAIDAIRSIKEETIEKYVKLLFEDKGA